MGVKGMYSKNDEFKKSVGLLFYYSKVSLHFRGHIKIQILFIPIMPTIYSIKNKNVWPLFDLPYSIQPEDEIYGSKYIWIWIQDVVPIWIRIHIQGYTVQYALSILKEIDKNNFREKKFLWKKDIF